MLHDFDAKSSYCQLADWTGCSEARMTVLSVPFYYNAMDLLTLCTQNRINFRMKVLFFTTTSQACIPLL